MPIIPTKMSGVRSVVFQLCVYMLRGGRRKAQLQAGEDMQTGRKKVQAGVEIEQAVWTGRKMCEGGRGRDTGR